MQAPAAPVSTYVAQNRQNRIDRYGHELFSPPTGWPTAPVRCGVISDIEMPRMDGFTLTRNIREHPVLKDVPIVLFSSIVSRDNEKKGEQVGADAQIAKGNYRDLVATLAGIIRQRDHR